jgi:hypothetical protein
LKDVLDAQTLVTFGQPSSHFLSNKGNLHNTDIFLEENNRMIKDQTEVAI